MRVLIAGCGYVGSALGGLLASEGYTVFGLRRNPVSLPHAIEPVVADLSRPITSETLPGALDLVFYTTSAGSSDDAAYRAAYVDGPRNLLEALVPQRTSIRRLFSTSSTGVYGQMDGGWVDEFSPTEPASRTGRRLLEGERVIAEDPMPTTVVRLSGIYGPGRVRSIERALASSTETLAEDTPPTYTNRIHRDDCAGALRHLMLLQEPSPLYLLSDCEPADRQTVAEWLNARLDNPSGPPSSPPSGPLPEGPLSGTQRPVRRRTNKRCDNTRLITSGYEFRYPTFREGFAELLKDVWWEDLPTS